MVADILDALGQIDPVWGYLVLAASAAIEYIFPPFPGDAILLVGGVLVGAHGWSAITVWIAVTTGAMGGAMAVFRAGQWLRHHPESWLGERLARPRLRSGVDRVKDGFRRHGAIYLVANRFLPGIRSVFFVAAGLADLRPRVVLFWGAVSASLWNAAVLGGGVLLGGSVDELSLLLERYTAVAWAIVAVAAVVILWRWRRAEKRDASPVARD